MSHQAASWSRIGSSLRIWSFVLSAIATACGGADGGSASSEPRAPSPSATESSAVASPSPTLPPNVSSVVALEGEVYGIEAGGGYLWAEAGAPGEQGALFKIDPATGEVVDSLRGVAPTVVGPDLWYATEDRVVRADARTGRTREKYPVSGWVRAVGAGSLWSVEGAIFDSSLVRVDLETKKVLASIELPSSEPKSAIFYRNAVWVVMDGNLVVRVDPATNKITDEIEAGIRPHSVAVGFGSVWVDHHGDDAVIRIDPARARIVATIDGAGYVNPAITVGEGFVWAATDDGLAKIDPETNEIVDTIGIDPGEYYDVAVEAGAAWLTTIGLGAVYRIETT